MLVDYPFVNTITTIKMLIYVHVNKFLPLWDLKKMFLLVSWLLKEIREDFYDSQNIPKCLETADILNIAIRIWIFRYSSYVSCICYFK